MKLAGTLIKSGFAVAGAGIYLFFRRLIKNAKKTEKEMEKKIKTKKRVVTKKTTAIPRQKKTVEPPVN